MTGSKFLSSSILTRQYGILGRNNLGGPILLIVLGLYLLVKLLFDQQRLFGKTEEG